MPLDRARIISALKQKGFIEGSGDHNYFLYHTTQNKMTNIFTKTSHGSGYKTLGDELVSKMAKQCKLPTKQFKEFVSCALSRESYEKLLVEAGHITLDKKK
jgi:hypothetical protein